MREEINYRLGLDIGITSVGWSVINLDEDRIEDLGVRIFNAAENPKDGASLAMPRRLARGRRRLLRRKAYRVNRVKDMIVKRGILSDNSLKNLFESKEVIGVWEARAIALDRKTSNEEFAKILINLCKRRGFKSNRKNEAKEKETGEILTNIIRNKERLAELNYRTVGELVYREVEKSEDLYKAYRNKEGQYTMCVSRDMIRAEIHEIFESQRRFNNIYATDEIEDEYLKIFDSQRPFSKLEDLEKMVGYCTFEKKKFKRAPKHCISAEEFTLYDNINKISIVCNGEKRNLTEEERNLIVEEAFKKKEIKYTALRKLLELDKEDLFSSLTYSIDKDISKTENTKFISMIGYHEIKKSIEHGVSKAYFEKIKENRKLLNDIAYVLTLAKTDEEIKKHLHRIGVEDEAIDSLLDISFSKFNNLSVEALEKILPYIKEGYQYNEACERAGYNFKAIYEGVKSKKLPVIEIDEIVNPVVNRALAQTRKVINAVIDRYGSPEGINIELARELAKNFKDRKTIEKEQKENRDNRDKIREELKSLFRKEPTGFEILKYRLWEQQKGECAYSQNRIPITNLFDPGAYEIDHIIPFSRTFDDSLANKVLVIGKE
ncbi:type II CRISPR RNA-guided endonuclease Cas9, partial [Clostridium sp.]|uniref:type II CRISPR RNA-guided endonuclease Cas9 n=1 Tax=Clostridium sp. TaxID=1506 RepID=UPI00262303E8